MEVLARTTSLDERLAADALCALSRQGGGGGGCGDDDRPQVSGQLEVRVKQEPGSNVVNVEDGQRVLPVATTVLSPHTRLGPNAVKLETSPRILPTPALTSGTVILHVAQPTSSWPVTQPAQTPSSTTSAAPPFKCRFCGKEMRHERTLRQHEAMHQDTAMAGKTQHQAAPTCHICGRRFQVRRLTGHTWAQLTNPPSNAC